MKKFVIILLVLCFAINVYNPITAQDNNVTITYTYNRIQSHGSNQLAIWIEDTLGNHITTIYATKYTANGGYIRRPVSLSEWTSKFDLKNASKEEVDAISGSTPQSGKQTVTWNGKDRKGKIIDAGTFIVRMEANIHDTDKMFFKAKIKIGAGSHKTNGEITYSRPELANGEVLFKDVVVEYK